MNWIDTHCHLNDEIYKDEIEQILSDAKQAGVDRMVVVGYDLVSSEKAVELAHSYACLYAMVGIHPSEANQFDVYIREKLATLLTEDKVVALGEIGLDYHYKDGVAPAIQKETFIAQLRLASELQKPVSIHMRDATADTYAILKQELCHTGVMHCFSGSVESAKQFMELGMYISLAGPVTFKNAVHPKEVAVQTPLSRLLIETDCPYLTPHPYRGQRNAPHFVQEVGKEVARLRQMEEKELSAALAVNAATLFHW